MVSIIVILSIPAVQTRIAKIVTNRINEDFGTKISIDRLGLNWKGQIDVRKIYIEDHQQDTLIAVDRLNTTIQSVRNLLNDKLDFGDIRLRGTSFYITTYPGDEEHNLDIFLAKFDSDKPPSTNQKVFELFATRILIEDGRFRVIDLNDEEPLAVQFDDLFIDIQDFLIYNEDISTRINHLSLKALKGYEIGDLEGDYCYNSERMTLENMLLTTEDSQIKGDLSMDYAEKGMQDFKNNVKLIADLRDSRVSTNDIKVFYDEFGSNIDILVEGNLEGTLNSFIFQNVELSTLSSRVQGYFEFDDLFQDDKGLRFRAYDHIIRSNRRDLTRLLPDILGTSLPPELAELGYFTLRGNTVLDLEQLAVESQLETLLGQAEIDIDMEDISQIDTTTYGGTVITDGFNLGPLLGFPDLQQVTADVRVDGSGFSRETVNTLIQGRVDSLRFMDYNYSNIQVAGTFSKPEFNGKVQIDDPNLQMDFNGLVDITQSFNQYDFTADVEYMELNQLNLIKRDSISVFAGEVNMKISGTSEDDVQGTIEFKETFYQNEEEDYYFDDFLIIANRNGEDRSIEIRSPDILNGSLRGQFEILAIPDLFRNGIGSIYANYQPQEVTDNQFLSYEFEIYNKIVEVFVPEIQLGENTKIRGSVSSDESEFKLNFNSPEVLLYGNYLNKVKLQVDNDNPIYNTYISVDSIHTDQYRVTDLSLINKTLNDTLYIQSQFKGGDQKEDRFNLSLYHTINPNGKSVVGMKRSTIEYKENTWYLNKENNQNNKVVFDNDFQDVKIDSLVLNHEQEYIRMAGMLKGSNQKDVRVEFSEVNIDNITPKIDSLELDGRVNGSLRLLQQEGAYLPTADVEVTGVEMNEIPLGDLTLDITGNEDLTYYQVDSRLANEQTTLFSLIGGVDTTNDKPILDLDVNFREFKLATIEPFVADIFSDIRGDLSGQFKVSGVYDSPEMDGQLFLDGSGMKVPYLNLDFDLADNTLIFLDKQSFNLSRTTIIDTEYGTEAALFGSVTHEDFGNWNMDLKVESDRMLVLNTPPDEDELYYGTAFISGNAQFSGPLDELTIDAAATTESGTTFKIPISDAQSIGDDSFIYFISPEEKQARLSGEEFESKRVKGLTLNFDLDINENAEVEILVDQTNNSTLKGRGVGTLLIRINTLGKFDMFGDFLVINGTYDFKYKTLIQKQFEVLSGGSITWDGSPTGANLNLSAKYNTRANPSVLLDNPTANRKIPVEVLIDLSGEILQPDLDFRIDFPETSSTLKAELEYKLQNDQERESQALFLISTGSFRGDTGAFTNAGGSLVTESVNAIVADIFAGDDNKFSVIPYYETGSRTINQETADQLGVELTTQISERILINGKVGIPVGGVTDTQVAGDIEIQWLVNEDGSMRMSFFNRQADIQFIGEDQIFEQGAGISYSVDFDTFKELVDKLFNKEISLESEEENNNIVPDDNSYPVNFKPKNDN
ncbi:translocation/assembly module TamB domain-containing protein [Aureitalea marina]|uniref:translocation/assembly module TamB domain-containing protein n=1 Tax=Aureitalea marina TaxID=930804 RepID=UPI001FE8CAD2|nr:translocation/assembly module TamB domain-containing protein [Aureitalea marina]